MKYQQLKDDQQREAWRGGRISYLSGLTEPPCFEEALRTIWQAGYDEEAKSNYERGEA